MANEISVTCSVSQSYNGVSINSSTTKTLTVDSTQDGSGTDVQTIGATAEAITFNGDKQIGFVQITNIGSTNAVDIGWVNPPTEITLQPGEACQFRPKDSSNPTMYAKAAASTTDIRKVTTANQAAS